MRYASQKVYTAQPPQAHSRSPARTGRIWSRQRRSRDSLVRRVCTRLRNAYGLPRLGNPKDPLDDLIFIVLSNRTSSTAAVDVYSKLKREFGVWDHVLDQSPSRLQSELQPLGLARKRSRQLRAALRAIRERWGSCDLAPLRDQGDEEVHNYLTSLPGVSDKVAKCVMMYTLNRAVLPVDTHVYRVSARLGWVQRKRADQCHEELESLVPADLRHSFHVTCIAHGRAVCRARQPLCEWCVVRRDCNLYKSCGGALV